MNGLENRINDIDARLTALEKSHCHCEECKTTEAKPEEVTYSIGDIFDIGAEAKWMLIGNRKRAIWYALGSRHCYLNEIDVENLSSITEQEMQELRNNLSGSRDVFTRTFDYQDSLKGGK